MPYLAPQFPRFLALVEATKIGRLYQVFVFKQKRSSPKKQITRITPRSEKQREGRVREMDNFIKVSSTESRWIG